MGWKEQSYWLRGGIIGIIVSLILFGIIFSFQCTSSQSCPPEPPALVKTMGNIIALPSIGVSKITSALSNVWGPNMPSVIINIGIIINLILNLAAYFLIGALIGWVYGKIKSKTSS